MLRRARDVRVRREADGDLRLLDDARIGHAGISKSRPAARKLLDNGMHPTRFRSAASYVIRTTQRVGM